MKKESALKIILGISILGMLFSGYLSYMEIVQKSCALGGCSSILGVPVCVFGFVMYLIIFISSLLGLKKKKMIEIR